MENGLNTGIKAFDEMVGGVRQGEVIVIAGRPGMGKTTLALQILAKNCLDKKCLYLSSTDNITTRFNNIAFVLGNLNRYEHEKEDRRPCDAGSLSDRRWDHGGMLYRNGLLGAGCS